MLGSIDVNISYNGQEAQLQLVVVQGQGPSLLGKKWLEQIQLDWTEIHFLQDKFQPD